MTWWEELGGIGEGEKGQESKARMQITTLCSQLLKEFKVLVSKPMVSIITLYERYSSLQQAITENHN